MFYARKKKEKELEDYCIERICPICNFKKQTPCIVNKICNEEAVTDEEIEEAYKKMLEDKKNIEVILYDERLTTVEVQKIMIAADVSRNKRKKVVDSLAATLILQSYLDSIR